MSRLICGEQCNTLFHMSCVRVQPTARHSLMSWEMVFIWLLQLAGWSEMLMFALFTGGPSCRLQFPNIQDILDLWVWFGLLLRGSDQLF